jgi:hypothetical protein
MATSVVGVLTNQIGRAIRRAYPRRRRPEDATADLAGLEAYPEPTAVISLRHGRTYRAVDEDGRPILIITDGVTAAALDIGVAGLSYGVVTAAQRLADAMADYVCSLDAAWKAREDSARDAARGRHRRNGFRLTPWRHSGRRNSPR